MKNKLSEDFLKWLSDVDFSKTNIAELACEAYHKGQQDLSKELLPSLVETAGSMAYIREQTLVVTEAASTQLAVLIERAQKHG